MVIPKLTRVIWDRVKLVCKYRQQLATLEAGTGSLAKPMVVFVAVYATVEDLMYGLVNQ